MADLFHLRLLGPIELDHNGKEVRGFESRKAVALLGYIALRGQALSRSHLADLFWCDKTESQGRNNLSRVLHNLNSMLPGLFRTDHYTVELPRNPKLEIDTTAFEEALARATPEALLAAVDLYRDELMAGLFLDDCSDFEIWLVAERERWRQRVQDALQALATRHLTQGQLESALSVTTRLLGLDPTREDLHRQAMLFLARSGQTNRALSQYETCRRVLADELGAAPSPETTALYEQLRQGGIAADEVRPAPAPAPGPTRSSAHNLPAQLTSFVGREREVQELVARLRNPSCRLLTVVGPAGVGKTRLSVEAVRRIAGDFPGGVCFASLASLTSSQFLLTALMDASGFSPEGPGEPKAQFLDYMREKRMLLFLDTFEHLMEGIPLVLEILQAAPALKILITSSERLNVQGEWLIYVPGLAFPSLQEKEISASPAVKLFVDRAISVNPSFRLNADTQSDVVRICQLVEGIPLGLELAAAWVGKFPCHYIAGEIERNLDFLTTTLRDLPVRHRSLRAALDWSYNLLSPLERRLLRRLAIFGGSFSLAAVPAVCTRPEEGPEGLPRDRPALLNLLGGILDKGLLRSRPGPDGEPRFSHLGPVRGYLQATLDESGERPWLEERQARMCLALVEEAAPQLTSPARVLWLPRLEAEYDNIRAAFAWTLRDPTRGEMALRFAGALIWYWYLRNYLFEGRQWVEQALAAGSHLAPTPALARVLFGAGAGAWLHGDYATARGLLDQSMQLSRRFGSKRDLAYALTIMGGLLSNLGEFAEARTRMEESAALFRELSDKWGLALSLANLDAVARHQGDHVAAQKAGEEAVALFRELQDLWGIAFVLSNRGLHAYLRGDFLKARGLHSEALAVRRGFGDNWLIAQSHYNLGNIARSLGDFDLAFRELRTSLELNRELGTRHHLAECLEAFGALAAVQEDAARAARLLGAADALRETMGAPLPVYARAEYDRHMAQVRARLDRAAWNTAWNEGRAMSLERAADYALEPPGGAKP